MPAAAIPSAASLLKTEDAEVTVTNADGQARKHKRRDTTKETAAAASSTGNAAAKSRVKKPAARTPTGTLIRSKKLRLIAEAEVAATTVNAVDDSGDGRDSSNSSKSDNSANGNNIDNSSISNNNCNKKNSKKSEASQSTSSASSSLNGCIPPPRPAEEVFARLPDDANHIDRAIFAQLALVWTEEAGRWTEAMRLSLLDILPRARVTRSTATLGNQYVCRMVRQSYAERGVPPTWGQFVVMRSMFGPATCFRQRWAAALAQRYPLAREDAYEGVVPPQARLVRDILAGRAGMPAARHRKEGIMQLGRERTRNRTKAAGLKDEESEAGGGGGGLLAGLKMEADEEEDAEAVQVSQDVWNEAAASAGRMDPGVWLAKMRRRYAEKEAQMKTLQEDMRRIRKSVDAFSRMADVVMEG